MDPGSKQAATADLIAAHRTFTDRLRRVRKSDVSVAVEGEWSAKELLLHLGSWNELLYLDLERLARGHIPVLAAFVPEEVDDWNAALMRGRAEFPFKQALFELGDRYDRLKNAIDALADHLFERDGIAARLVRSQALHYSLHTRSLTESLK
ncbi:MAG: DinB family protein [Dehalococcoidia bacterium]